MRQPIFDSCGHPPPPLPLTLTSSPSTSRNIIPGYCRACDFTHTRQTIERLTNTYNARIAELQTCIERAKEALWREWTDELGVRKEMAVVVVGKLRREKMEAVERSWGEFDGRWGGRPVAQV
ncbi:MAG: hypothetical protein M1830_004558 [Pleopsidium flavum]|nr:MAG: hypothetical protein M1830_004558 [Pleopsidium flavum]